MQLQPTYLAQETTGRVLSVQSHVAYGYVGNKAAVFPLQCLGYDVDVVNTVNFSNHSGYGRIGGTRTKAEELDATFRSMEDNELLKPGRLLTGYIPSPEALTVVKNLAERLRRSRPDLIYVLDPVMGDSGKLYVAPSVVPVYQSMLSLATIITPNYFEVETLTGTPITSLSSLQHALRILHESFGVPNVVMSSMPLGGWLLASLPKGLREAAGNGSDKPLLICVASSRSAGAGQDLAPSTVHVCVVPQLPGYFSGVGDIFSALVLAHYHPSESHTSALAAAVGLALSKTHALLTLTHAHAESLPEKERQPSDDELDGADPFRKIRRMKGRELRMIQGQDIIRGTGIFEMREMIAFDGFWAAGDQSSNAGGIAGQMAGQAGPLPSFNPSAKMQGNMAPSASPGMNKDAKDVKPGINTDGSPRNEAIDGQKYIDSPGTAPPVFDTGNDQAQPPPPSSAAQQPPQPSLNHTPTMPPNVLPSPSSMHWYPPSGMPSGGMGPSTLNEPMFTADLTNSVTNGLDEFAYLGARGDMSLNFERDFGQWFNHPDDMPIDPPKRTREGMEGTSNH